MRGAFLSLLFRPGGRASNRERELVGDSIPTADGCGPRGRRDGSIRRYARRRHPRRFGGRHLEHLAAAAESSPQHGGSIDLLYYVILWVTGIIFVAVWVVMAYFLVKYRHNPDRKKGLFTHGNTRLEMAWTLDLAVILILPGPRGPAPER